METFSLAKSFPTAVGPLQKCAFKAKISIVATIDQGVAFGNHKFLKNLDKNFTFRSRTKNYNYEKEVDKMKTAFSSFEIPLFGR